MAVSVAGVHGYIEGAAAKIITTALRCGTHQQFESFLNLPRCGRMNATERLSKSILEMLGRDSEESAGHRGKGLNSIYWGTKRYASSRH